MKIYLYFFLTLFLLNTACSSNEQKEQKQVKEKGPIKSLDYYNLASPEKFNMPESLLEISGIAFRKKNDTIYAINDETGNVFRLAWKVPKQYHSKFGKKVIMKI
ncbi:hypothetical protein Dfri01_46510 [Dyadobacter frigoris]|uniref:hypothetical protein n=1 Tax=Dyadobacter frigoris TaxID=2576211 RepID=UPI0024A4CECF|nr:hypothetical protein [Dyadobacter frigoris]GLU55190.1 hypothetical protein Dfri01_46510 [Dyadobacter frigoris]